MSSTFGLGLRKGCRSAEKGAKEEDKINTLPSLVLKTANKISLWVESRGCSYEIHGFAAGVVVYSTTISLV